MANLTPTPSWDSVFQLETNTPVLGGAGGVSNSQAQSLLNRTAFLEGATGSSKVGHTPAGIGAVATTVEEVFGRRVWVENFMSEAEKLDVKSASPSLDITASIQKAIDYAFSLPYGATVLFSDGFWNYTTLNLKNKVSLKGSGFSTRLHSTNTTRLNGINCVGTALSYLEGCSVDNMFLTSTFDNNGITTGNALRYRFVKDSFITNLWAYNWSDSGVSITDCDKVIGDTVNIKTCSQGYDIFNGSVDCTVDQLTIEDIQTFVGLNIEGLAGGSTARPLGCGATNVIVRGATTHGINILNSDKPFLDAFSVSGTVGSVDGPGNGIEVYGCTFPNIGVGTCYENAGHGIVVGPTADDTKIGAVITVDNALGSILITDGGGIGTSNRVQIDPAAILFEGPPTLSGNVSIASTRQHGGTRFKNSDDAAPEVLDWYLEGTFTPTVSGTVTSGSATYTERSGRYQRIGNRVFFTISLGWSAHTGTGDLAAISGLPFVSANVVQPSLSIYNNGYSAASGTIQAFVSQAASTVTVNQVTTTTGAAAALPLDTVVTDLRISGHYLV